MNAKNIAPGIVGGEPPDGFHLEVRTRGFELTDALYQRAVDHIAAKVARHARFISLVTVRLEDVNGPKGGLDKRCRVELLIAGAAPIIVDETDQDAYAAVDLAGERLGIVVDRMLAGRRARRRQRGRRLARETKLLH
ncbi:MAG TPA: HPF/RaiA family ribosome-associated protein [Polyangia bacterium]